MCNQVNNIKLKQGAKMSINCEGDLTSKDLKSINNVVNLFKRLAEVERLHRACL